MKVRPRRVSLLVERVRNERQQCGLPDQLDKARAQVLKLSNRIARRGPMVHLMDMLRNSEAHVDRLDQEIATLDNAKLDRSIGNVNVIDRKVYATWSTV